MCVRVVGQDLGPIIARAPPSAPASRFSRAVRVETWLFDNSANASKRGFRIAGERAAEDANSTGRGHFLSGVSTKFRFLHSSVQSTPTMRGMRYGSQIVVGPNSRATGADQSHLLKNGAPAHELTPEDRAKGGRARAEKIRRRKELRDRFEAAELEDLSSAELDLLDRALVRLNLLLASDDDRVALRACVEIFDRVLGRPRQQQEYGRSRETHRDMDAALAQARNKFAVRLGCQAARSVTPGEQQ